MSINSEFSPIRQPIGIQSGAPVGGKNLDQAAASANTPLVSSLPAAGKLVPADPAGVKDNLALFTSQNRAVFDPSSQILSDAGIPASPADFNQARLQQLSDKLK